MSDSTPLTDSERRAYEAYLLATTDEQRQEAITKLVPGSHIYYHLYFLDRFRRLGGKPFTAEEQKLYNQFSGQYYYSPEFKQIEARFTLLRYDEASTKEE